MTVAPNDAAIRRARPVTVRDDASDAAIESYVASHPTARAYHRPRWLATLRSAFGHRTRYLAATIDDRICGVLPLMVFESRVFGRFVVSVPFVNYGGVLADDALAEQALLAAAVDTTRRAGASHLELRHDRQVFSELAAKRHKVAMELALADSSERQWNELDRKVRNQVRKAEKSQLTVVDGGPELLAEFYTVFAHNMRDLGTPVYARGFFERVLAAFPMDTRVFVVRAGGRPAAVSLVHWHRDTIEVPWASALREFNPVCANVFLYWHMLRFAIERGFKVFDFGRSTPGEGTFHFKAQWGAVPRELVWEYWLASGGPLPELNPKNPKFGLAIKAWQRLPVSVATALGPMIVKNIP